MKLIVVSGFLGAGKTTFITRLAEAVTKRARKAAILVNEIGDIGIDNQFMQRLGLNVWEILGGCICCTLSGNLHSALEKLRDYEVDIVLLEPSGAADLRSIRDILVHYQEKMAMTVQKLTLVDSLRLEMLLETVGPLIEAQIASADLVLINKADVLSALELEKLCARVETMTKGVSPLIVSAKKGIEPSLLEELLT